MNSSQPTYRQVEKGGVRPWRSSWTDRRYGGTVVGCARGGATVGGMTHEETRATVQGRQSGGVGSPPER
eukprot:2366172-Pleurochrysis_carterae.AAC.1